VHFAVLLRDRAKSDLVTPSDSILDITFENLMDSVVDGMVIVALVSALFSIFGVVLVYLARSRRRTAKCTVTELRPHQVVKVCQGQ
jgi:LPS O-antigen subunit length determinant protein (WzzB/FepE family)